MFCGDVRFEISVLTIIKIVVVSYKGSKRSEGCEIVKPLKDVNVAKARKVCECFRGHDAYKGFKGFESC
jgi:hypothetical protein